MSQAFRNFESGIKDADELLEHFDRLNCKPPPPNAEVLKRAALVMALTAWETYVEDLLKEIMQRKLGVVAGSYIGDFVSKRLQQDLKQFHNPNAEKTRKIFLDYVDLDVTEGWRWNNFEPDKVKKSLNEWIGKRGDVVHRSRPVGNGGAGAHFIKRDELDKAIRFIKDLVKANDAYVEKIL